MLYVFRMDIGHMLTIDMSFLMDTVYRLQLEITRITNIPPEKQILLVSGGHGLKPDQKVISYGAGADTNPVFLFSRKAFESKDPPLIKASLTKDVLSALKESLTRVMNMPPQIECVSTGTKIACQIRDSATKILNLCKAEFKEQHLQYQGWGTVVANLEEIAQALQHSKIKFSKAMATFIPMRDQYFTMLENFTEVLDLLQRIPLLKALREEKSAQTTRSVVIPGTGRGGRGMSPLTSKSLTSGHGSFIMSTSFTPATLLDWITMQGQGQSLESLRHKCREDLLVFDQQMFETISIQVEEVLKEVNMDPHHNKELVGIERRLSDLEKRYNEAARIAEEQHDVTQNFFLKHASNLSRTAGVGSVLPDLCHAHKQQLHQMVERQQRIEALHNNFLKSKQEMCTNIHQRLGWVMHVETNISKLDNDLIFHMKTMKILECNLELLTQVKVAPKVYADIVVEAGRRCHFSKEFSQWAETVAEDSTHIYNREIERRKSFSSSIGDHFLLDTLFKGLEDMPPNFATKAPKPFDRDLPEITNEDMEQLWLSAPELHEVLRVSDSEPFYPDKERTESPFAHIMFPAAQSSQTEWSGHQSQPSIVKATEAPPTKFTLPEVQESKSSKHIPQVSSSISVMMTRKMDDSRNRIAPQQEEESKIISEGNNTSSSTITPSEMTQSAASSKPSPAPGLSNLPAAAAGQKLPLSPSSPIERDPHSKLGVSPPQTESTSPPSSTEFATADFYFEDSMPSPLASSSERQREDSIAGTDSKRSNESTKSSSAVAVLQAELASREKLIRELEAKLKESNPPLQTSQPHDGQPHLMLQISDIPDPAALSLSEGGSSTPPMEDALDISLIVGSSSTKQEALKSSSSTDNALVEQLQRDLEVVTSDLKKAKADLAENEKLRLDLDKANEDLAKAKDNLLESEIASSEREEASKRELQDRDKIIKNLKGELHTVRADLDQTKSGAAQGEKQLTGLREELENSKLTADALLKDVEAGKESLRQVKAKLLIARDNLLNSLSPLRQGLAELRSSVENNREKQKEVAESALTSFEKEVIKREKLAESEKEALREEIQQLKAKLLLAESATAEQCVHLKTVKDECADKLASQEQVSAKKLEDVRVEYQTTLKDQETKHALELELELDRCGSELKEKDEALAKMGEEMEELKEKLESERREARQASDAEIERLALAYSENLRQAEESNNKGMEAATARLKKEYDALLEEKRKELEENVVEHTTELAGLRLELESDKETALRSQQEKLEAGHEAAQAELRAKMAELRETMTKTLEQTQLDHVNKLTQLKTKFEQERDVLKAEVSSYRDRPRSESGTEPDLTLMQGIARGTQTEESQSCHRETQTQANACCGETQTELLHSTCETQTLMLYSTSDTQTEEMEGEGTMITSETQTDLNLLSEVISLNSSISYGSDEMIAQKLSTSATGDETTAATITFAGMSIAAPTSTPALEDGKATAMNAQETIDDLNLQLACAQEKIASLNEEIRSLMDKVKEPGSLSSPVRADFSPLALGLAEGDSVGKSGISRSTYQDLMTASNPAASFILMEGEPSGATESKRDEAGVIKSKDQRISQLEKRLRDVTKDKVSIKGCDKSDIVLLCLDESHDQYVVFTVGTYLHFLHTESLEPLGLKSSGDSKCKKSWILAEVVDKEFCLAKKPNNRFRVPQGTCFYRVKCKPWKTESNVEHGTVLSRSVQAEHLSGKHSSKSEASGARPKKSK